MTKEKEMVFTKRFNAEFDAEFYKRMLALKKYFNEKTMKGTMVKCVNFVFDSRIQKLKKTNYKTMVELMEEYGLTAAEAKELIEKQGEE